MEESLHGFFFGLFSRVEIARSLGSVLGLSSKLGEELDVGKCWGYM